MRLRTTSQLAKETTIDENDLFSISKNVKGTKYQSKAIRYGDIEDRVQTTIIDDIVPTYGLTDNNHTDGNPIKLSEQK